MKNDIQRINRPFKRFYKKEHSPSKQYHAEDKLCRSCKQPLPRSKSPFGFIYTLICPKCGSNN